MREAFCRRRCVAISIYFLPICRYTDTRPLDSGFDSRCDKIMVAAKYERISSGTGHASEAEEEEIELELDLGQKNRNIVQQNGKDGRHRQTNFKYVTSSKTAKNGGSGTSGDSTSTATLAQEKMTESRFMQMAIGTLFIILLYLSLSILLTFYQTDINRAMPFPLAIVSYHLILKFLLAAIIRRIYKLKVGRSRVQLDWRVALRKMAPTGVASAIDIGFSNWGLALVPISLYTMTKSSTIVFILLFAIALGLEKKVSASFINYHIWYMKVYIYRYSLSAEFLLTSSTKQMQLKRKKKKHILDKINDFV